MNKARLLLDEIIKKMTPPPNATISESFDAYNKAIDFLEEALKTEFDNGYDAKKMENIKKQTKEN